MEQQLPLEQQLLVLTAGWLFTFPLLLLSSLENGSLDRKPVGDSFGDDLG